MHEMALMHEVVRIVLSECEKRPVKKVRAVHLTIGEMRDVFEEYVPGLFKHLARNTVAAEADVVIHKVPFRVRCNACGEIFSINIRDDSTWVCPHCQARQNYRVYSGDEFRVESIDYELLPQAVAPTSGVPATAARALGA